MIPVSSDRAKASALLAAAPDKRCRLLTIMQCILLVFSVKHRYNRSVQKNEDGLGLGLGSAVGIHHVYNKLAICSEEYTIADSCYELYIPSGMRHAVRQAVKAGATDQYWQLHAAGAV